MQDCCRTGFRWNGTPKGRTEKLGENETYVVGDGKERAILICHDAFGWAFNNTRLLADHYAEEVGATVYVPDFFENNAVSDDDVWIHVGEDGKAEVGVSESFDFPTWFSKNNPDARKPEIVACARLLRERYSKLGVVGYCWGGQAGFLLASEGLVDCFSIAHPGAPTENQVRSIQAPFQLVAPEHDPQFPWAWSEFCNKEIPKLGVPYSFQYFPGMKHGFSTKCDENDPKEKKAVERAKNAVVFWMASNL